MSKKSKDKRDRPHFEVALLGGGVRPDTVPAGQLARLVIEAVSLLEAVARERGLEAPPVFLQGIRKGSCVARLYPIDHGRDDPFERIAAHTHRVIETRAETAAPSVRAAVERIWSLAQTGGAPVRIAARNISHLKAAPKAVMVAEPIRQQRPSARSATILHGRIVGMEEVSKRIDIKLKVRDGKKLTLECEPDLARRAVQRFGADVRVRASVERDADGQPNDSTWSVEAIEPWEQGDFLEGAARVRQALRETGHALDVAKALALLEDEEDGDV